MNARHIVFTSRETAELQEAAPPDQPPAPNEVAGRTLFSLISPGTELACYRGCQGMTFPRGSGYAAVFEVEQAGAEVRNLKPGDRAFCMGPHASTQRVAADSALLVPKDLAGDAACFARLMGVGWSTLTTTTARPPDRVLVTGLGVIGHLTAKVFQVAGYTVYAVDPSERRRSLARANGVTNVFPSVPTDNPDLCGTFTLAIECSGREQAALDACDVVCKRGEVALVGVPWERQSDATAFDVLHRVFHKYVVLRSGWEWELPRHAAPFQPRSILGNLAGALQWLAEGRLRVDALYARRSPSDAQAAYQSLLSQRTDHLTYVFDWS